MNLRDTKKNPSRFGRKALSSAAPTLAEPFAELNPPIAGLPSRPRADMSAFTFKEKIKSSFTSYILLASALLFGSASKTNASYREWTNQQGSTIEAMLLEQSAHSIKIRKPDGSTFNYPTENLSKADQEYLKSVEQFYDEAKQDVASNKDVKTLPGFPIEYTNNQGHRYFVFLVTNSVLPKQTDPFAASNRPRTQTKGSEQEINLVGSGIIAYYRSGLEDFDNAERLIAELPVFDIDRIFNVAELWSPSGKKLAYYFDMTTEEGFEGGFVITFSENQMNLEPDSEWQKVIAKKFSKYTGNGLIVLKTIIDEVTWRDDSTLIISKHHHVRYYHNGSEKETKRRLELELRL